MQLSNAFVRTPALKTGKKSRLAREAGMADTVLRRFHSDDWNPTAETLRRLEAAIPQDFHVASGVKVAEKRVGEKVAIGGVAMGGSSAASASIMGG